MLPNVDIDSISSGSVSENHVPPEPKPALSPADAVIQVLIGLNMCEFNSLFKEKSVRFVKLLPCYLIILFY